MSDRDDMAAAGDLERRLATILSADVAAYSRLMAEDEEETLRVFRGHKEVFEKLVALHRGRIFNTAGDAILAEFGSAVEAVRCATEIQAALRTRNDQLPEARQVQFRIGVNLGDVMVQDHDLLGDGVNVAARLQSAAAPGGICIAGSVYDQIRNRLSLSFKPLGDMKYKNIPQAVRTFSIVEAEGLGELPAPPAEPVRQPGLERWPIAAGIGALLVVLAAGGVWVYSGGHHPNTDLTQPADKQPGVSSTASSAALESQKPEAAITPAAPLTPVAPPNPAAAQPPPTPVPTADDGVYAGPICFGATQTEPTACIPFGPGILKDGSFSGQWPGRDRAITWHLAGDVSASGHVTIQLHNERADGTRIAMINLAGTLKDGVLDASGALPNGRTATLDWRKGSETQASAALSNPAPTPAEPMPAAAPAAAAPPAVTRPAPAAAPSGLGSAGADGVYAGPICLGPGPADVPRCFRAQATVEQGRITGQWPGRDPSITMHLEGNVLPSGAVRIHMHANAANGAVRAQANLTGTLHDGKLDAAGAFLNGRTASLNWSKN